MIGHVFKVLMGVAGCALAALAGWLWLNEGVPLPVDLSPQAGAAILAGIGVVLMIAVFWPRARSLVGLVGMMFGTAAAIWAILYADFNVWQLIPVWIVAFVGTFATLVYLIAFCRGKDAF